MNLLNTHPLMDKLKDLETLQCSKLSNYIVTLGNTITRDMYKMETDEATGKRKKGNVISSAKIKSRNHHEQRPPKYAGIYVFWWTGDKKLLQEANGFNEILRFKNSKGGFEELHIYDYWKTMNIDAFGPNPIPLYIGKAGNIFDRYCKHMMLKTPRLLPLGKVVIEQCEEKKGRKYSTSVQLRDRIDRVFPDVGDTLGLLLDNVGFSYVCCDDKYMRSNLEYLAIGYYRAVFNTDIER